MSELHTSCPLCGSDQTTSRGPIVHPDPPMVAGVPIDLGSACYELRSCVDCGFQYKWPGIDEDALLACYQRADAGHWEDTPDPRKRRFDELRALIQGLKPTGRLLDIGCFNGALQNYLGEAWTHCGIEPADEAAKVARSRGVEILGPTIESLADADVDLFDVVLAIDVVEHLPRPLAFFESAARVLAPGGIAVYGTGDTDARSWRMLGSRYWYCALPEHVSFYNRRSMQHIAHACSLESVEHVQTSHIRARPDKRLRQAIRNSVFAATIGSAGLGITSLRSRVDRMTPPGWLAARDHMLHVMRAAQ